MSITVHRRLRFERGFFYNKAAHAVKHGPLILTCVEYILKGISTFSVVHPLELTKASLIRGHFAFRQLQKHHRVGFLRGLTCIRTRLPA